MDRREIEGIDADLDEFFFVVGETAAGTAKCKCWTKYHRISDVKSCSLCFLKIVSDLGRNDRFTYGLTHFLEKFAVFRTLYAGGVSTEKLNSAFSENALFFQLHGQVQTGLSADTGDDGVRSFIAKDLGDIFKSKRFHVDLISDACIGHDGSRVGVAENDLIAFFF